MAVEGLHRHPYQGIIRTTIARPSAAAVDKLGTAYTAFVLDLVGKHGALSPAIQPLAPGMKVCGPAVTVLGSDLSVRRMAINVAQPGDVLVVAAGGQETRACFGDGTALKMMRKGLAGAVIDGMTRDRDGVVALGFPTFCRGATPRNFHYPDEGLHGGINVPVVCGGVLVNPGDLIFADGDGVIAVRREVAEQIADAVVHHLEEERAQRAAITEFEPFPVESELRALGYRFEQVAADDADDAVRT